MTKPLNSPGRTAYLLNHTIPDAPEYQDLIQKGIRHLRTYQSALDDIQDKLQKQWQV
jgi:hypothetical protein